MAAANLVSRTTGPHLLFIALRDGGSPALHWVGRSGSKRESKAQIVVGLTGGDQPNMHTYRYSMRLDMASIWGFFQKGFFACFGLLGRHNCGYNYCHK